MAGYNYTEGMSNNALDAYNEGKKPLSKITIKDLKESGWKGTKKQALDLAKNGHWKPSEWHHSGGTWYNQVSFYDLQDLLDIDSSLSVKESVNEKIWYSKINRWLENKNHTVKGSFPIFGGSRSRPKFLGEQEFKGILKGNWIFLDDGGKKKADGNNIKWELKT
jgi:hypothetical protein|tara:strand:- start:234 stop:725 length:492 start_codon:yes stop_codon:yes gene_type:complete